MADTIKTNKLDRYNSYLRRHSTTLLFRATIIATVVLIILLLLPHPPPHISSSFPPSLPLQIRLSATPLRPSGLSVLVTGAAGFIGSHSSLALKSRGDGVVGLDNFNSFYSPSLKRSRQHLLSLHSILLLDADLSDSPLLSLLLSSHPFSHILHLAAPPPLPHPHSYISSNIAAFISLLESASKSSSPQPAIVFASSSSVYGLNPTASPFSESDRTDRPASLYAATKKAAEAIAHSYNHIYGLSLTALRFFTVYGPFGRPDMAYFSFTKSIIARRPITIYRGASRGFTYIDDVVAGCLRALDTAERSTGVAGGKGKRGPAQFRTYNIGNTETVSVARLVDILEGILGVKAERRVVEMMGNGDVLFTHANVSLAARELGYRPKTDLETGLRKFVRWYVRYYGIEVEGRAVMQL